MFTFLPRSVLLAALGPLALQALSLPVVVSRSGSVKSGTLALGKVDASSQYSVLYSLSDLSAIKGSVQVEILAGNVRLLSRTLHAGDPDFYTQFRVSKAGTATMRVTASQPAGRYLLQVNRWPRSEFVRSGPMQRWQDAMPIKLGTVVFATGDDAPYIPPDLDARRRNIENAAGTDWYRFEFGGDRPKLVFFQVELTDRDQIPVNVTVHREVNGKLEEFTEGEDPVTLPHEVQALPGNKFTPRILTQRGTYYISVRASHPEYKLRTRLYDTPPYADAQAAVRTAVDYVLAAGDSWHANTPRRGGVLDRVAAVHQETSLCVACHATHFPQRAQLYATRNGYPVVQRQQLQFLAERFYNNPRPFYGFEEQGATWARMISASANVLSRMSHLMQLYESEVSRESRPSLHRGAAEYLKLYYADRDKLPPDETNGNTPLVSAHEVAWYAWSVTNDPRLPELIASGEVKNTIDLCYQTLALAEMDSQRFASQIAKNAERILSLQRADGQWSASFDPKQRSVEFQTGHALWALHAARVPASHPAVAKSIRFLLSRQQPFGGWMDPLQSFENFRTPFRETQMAVLALSSYFPLEGRAKGWNAGRLDKLSPEPVVLLQQLDEVWDQPSAEALVAIREVAARSNDALIRQAATEALGRIGQAPPAALLGDASKLVQRSAAYAVRQALIRNPRSSTVRELLAGLADRNERIRWGASRVFAAHFSDLAHNPDFASALRQMAANDPVPTIRMAAVKALWQFWFWSRDNDVKSAIEDVLLARLGQEQHVWVQQNLRHAIYNVADENIRYLYNNWVPLLSRQEDRDRVVKGRLTVESRLAAKLAAALDKGTAHSRKQLLLALTELPLRRADVYQLDADLNQLSPPAYNRIGNDIEQIAFFGESADRLAKSLTPLMESSDPEMRTLASRAGLLVREARFGDVNRIAGPAGPATKAMLAKLENVPEAKEILATLKPPPPPAARVKAAAAAPAPRIRLDETYFRGYVQPILEKRGKDGYACVHCHSSHTLFNGSYGTALNVVNTAEPDKSLLLLKPTSGAETEGIAGSDTIAHGGGVRWLKDSAEYNTILEWIKGARE